MSEVVPPKYAAYPRNTAANYGTPEQLEALGSGYFGLSFVFLAQFLLTAVAISIGVGTGVIGFLVVMAISIIIVAVLQSNQTKSVAFGKGWSSSKATAASILMIAGTIFCLGLLGYVIMQTIALNEMRKYGVQSSWLGLRKKDFQAVLFNRKNAKDLPVPSYVP